MNFIAIKNRALRRCAMVVAFPIVAVEYVVRGLRVLMHDARHCWNYKHP